ncbi:MAG: MBL fold metallo-hydrolase [Longimicrobiales bacterium]
MPPPHYHPDGGFTDPWAERDRRARRRDGRGAFLRWRFERWRDGIEPAPPAGALPVVDSEIAYPAASPDELRVTWVGHATLLVQIGGLNILTDPIWARRASPVTWAGPARLVPAAPALESLPPIHVVLISHDHFDHLDRPTVRRLARLHPDGRWFTPLGYSTWLQRHGVAHITELDWWQTVEAGGRRLETGVPNPQPPASNLRPLAVTALPARHWTARNPFITSTRLWATWAVETGDGRRFFFGGDTGYFPGFAEIGERLGPFDVIALPIGAYEPAWFMQPVHMNPEEAVRAYRELGGRGAMVGIHWGTFRLADEPVLEPPARARVAWERVGLPARDLWIHRHGETRVAPLHRPLSHARREAEAGGGRR